MTIRSPCAVLISTSWERLTSATLTDVREPPALNIILLLRRLGAKVTFSDPHVNSIRIDRTTLESIEMPSAVEAADCVVIVTGHTSVDYASVVEGSRMIVDTRNALKGFRSSKIVRL